MFVRIFFLATLALTGSASAQQPPPAPARPAAPAVAAEPTSTTASYGDWVLRCQKTENARLCEVAQSLMVQGQATPIAQIAVGRPSPKDKLRLTVVLPNNVSFPAPPKLVIGEKDAGLTLAWRRCLPGGCFADVLLDDEPIKRLRALTDSGRLLFSDGVGREIGLPFSMSGLSQALDALAKEKE